jgi:hypothetical protein
MKKERLKPNVAWAAEAQAGNRIRPVQYIAPYDLFRVSNQIPNNTNEVPAATQIVNGSPRIKIPIVIVDNGPTIPI